MKVYIVGIGMGNPDTMTVEARRAVEQSQLLIGASRMLAPFEHLTCEKKELIRAVDIVVALHDAQNAGIDQVSVLVSGDVGLYSGAPSLYRSLDQFDVEVLPGVSSLQYFCAKLRVPWQDVTIVSAHGRQHNAVGAIQANNLVFCLTGGATKVQGICLELVERGMGDLCVTAGENLSYSNELIMQGRASELAFHEFGDLAVMLVENPHPVRRLYAAPSLKDADFERGRAPMTKQEVRALVISKLCLDSESIVWDVGAGTGSVSVELALAAPLGRVFAIERDQEALDLLASNKARHGAMNMSIVPGEAPDALAGLPSPTHVFIGGSGGHMRQIFAAALAASQVVRICATAVTLETLTELLSCIDEYGLESDIVQLSVSRAQQTGEYHLMKAENPVYIVTAWRNWGGVQ